MELILHIGAHGTDGGRIAGWIRQNQTTFEAGGVAVPDPAQFVAGLERALAPGQPGDPLAREEAFLRAQGATGARRRMVVSAPDILMPPQAVLHPEGFYQHGLAARLDGLRGLFPRTRVTLALAVRQASGLVPDLLAGGTLTDIDTLKPALSDETLPWTALVQGLRAGLPRARLVVWRHEDLPRVWPRVVAGMVPAGAGLPAAGLLELAAADLGAEARLRLGRYLSRTGPVNAGTLSRLAEVFADRFGRAGTPRAVLADGPAWLSRRLADLDAGYLTEWGDLSSQAGVQALQPRSIEG